MIDLSPRHLATIRNILRRYVPECRVRAFGSRVTGRAKSYSDLDLAVVSPGRLSEETLRLLREAFEESDLPFRVDVIDWHSTAADFQEVIERENEIVWPMR
jgi:type I restriction enzyme S subunit